MPRTNSARPAGAYRWLLLATIIATFVLIVVGATVRVTGSGLGCPDWPLCHGRIIPPLEMTAILEYSHRLAASLTSPLIVASALVGWLAWRRRDRRFGALSVLAVVLLAVQVVLGGITVRMELPPAIVTAHLSVAEALLAVIVVMDALLLVRDASPALRPARDGFHLAAVSAAAALFLLILTGAYLRGASGAWACGTSWPLCQGNHVYGTGDAAHLHMLHRYVTAVVSLGVLATAWMGWRRRRSLPGLGATAVAVALLLVAQIGAGALVPLTSVEPWARAVHLAVGTLLWIAVVALAALAWERRRHAEPGPEDAPSVARGRLEEGRPVPTGGAGAGGRHGASTQLLERTEVGAQARSAARTGTRPPGSILRDYVALTKPRIISLLLVTTLGGMFLAEGGMPPLLLAGAVMLGGYMAAGGANALNHYMDRDIDSVMRRTRMRPIPDLRVTPHQALAFGLALNALAFLELWAAANLLAAVLAMCGTVIYVLVYTFWLKRSTPSNIVIGGAAGAIPPLVGWAAVTGGLALPAWYLFAIIFFWTPPHFWALALLIRDDYAAASIPMLPVVEGAKATARAILLYTLLLVALTVLFAATDVLSWVYLAGAALLGAGFIAVAYQLLRNPERPRAVRVYKYSLLYLALLFAVIMVDGSFHL